MYTYYIFYKTEDAGAIFQDPGDVELSFQDSGEAGILFQDSNADGSNARMLIVDKFDPKYGYIDITAAQIDLYFKMSKAEIQKRLGKGRDDIWVGLEYADYGVTFSFSNDDSTAEILFDNNYQIEGIHSGMLFKDVMKIYEEKKLKKTPATENGHIYYLEYPFETFTLRYDSYDFFTSRYDPFDPDGTQGTIFVFSNKVKFDDLYIRFID